MSKRNPVERAAMAFCGIDVSAATLAAAVLTEPCGAVAEREFGNTASGHRQLIQWLAGQAAKVRVSLEATGVYSLEVSLALDRESSIELAVLNPKQANRFAQTLRRSKTDRADAVALAEFGRRMQFVRWHRPSAQALALRAITRHVAALSEQRVRLLNQAHAADRDPSSPSCVRRELRRSLAEADKAIARLRGEAIALVRRDPALCRRLELLTSVRGIGEVSAVQMLGELTGLDDTMSVRQWVAFSGLDPVERSSGSSVRRPARISRQGNRYLRRAMFMPAMAAARWDPHLRAFYLALQQRHKTKLQALIAVARKLLHAIYGIFKTATPYDGAKLFPHLITPS